MDERTQAVLQHLEERHQAAVAASMTATLQYTALVADVTQVILLDVIRLLKGDAGEFKPLPLPEMPPEAGADA